MTAQVQTLQIRLVIMIVIVSQSAAQTLSVKQRNAPEVLQPHWPKVNNNPCQTHPLEVKKFSVWPIFLLCWVVICIWRFLDCFRWIYDGFENFDTGFTAYYPLLGTTLVYWCGPFPLLRVHWCSPFPC